MQVILPFILSSLAGLSTIIGCLFMYVKPKNINKFIPLCLAFSLGIMILISITDLIPLSFISLNREYSLFNTILISLTCFLLGTIFTLFINKKVKPANESSLYRIGILSGIVLVLHNIPEGIATFMSSYQDISLGIPLTIAIMLHNIPEGICIAIPIYYATKNKLNALKYTLISGLSEPFGAMIAFIILKNYINDFTIALILIFVGGMMITLSINEILPEAKKYNENKYIYLGLILSIILIILNTLFF